MLGSLSGYVGIEAAPPIPIGLASLASISSPRNCEARLESRADSNTASGVNCKELNSHARPIGMRTV